MLTDSDYENLLRIALAASPGSIYVSDFESYVVVTYLGKLYKVTLMQEIDDIIADHESMTMQVHEILDLILVKDND